MAMSIQKKKYYSAMMRMSVLHNFENQIANWFISDFEARITIGKSRTKMPLDLPENSMPEIDNVGHIYLIFR